MTRILTLDDEPELLGLYRLILERAGYENVSTTSSQQALSILHNEPIDLLIQDIMRPDMDGWEFYGLMQADKALRHIPVLIATARHYPQMNLHQILTIKRTLYNPIVLTTAYPALRHRWAMNLIAIVRGLSVAWVDGYLSKPFGPRELVEAVKQILDKRRPARRGAPERRAS